MDRERAIAFIIFSVAAAITPGPSNMIILATGSAVGLRRGVACAAGAACGMASLIFCSALGLNEIVFAYPSLLKVMNFLGAAFLLSLAYKVARSGPIQRGGSEPEPLGFLGAAIFQWINPKGWIVALGATGAYLHGTTEGSIKLATAFGLLFFFAALACGMIWLILGAFIQKALRTHLQSQIFNLIMSVMLVASVFAIIR